MKLAFKRITSTGSFIPEIDGLRFIAIASVVIMHASSYIMIKDQTNYIDVFDFELLGSILHHAMLGVPIFFAISGFILGLPFAKYHINNGKPINLRAYFVRRLSRLEPPYIVVLTMLFFGYVIFFKTMPFDMGLKSYLSSLIYSHNIIYSGVHPFPLLNPNLWSLEIEIQFYILAPLLAYIFSVKPVLLRRGSLIIIALLFTMFNVYYTLPFLSIVKYFHYFLVGFLLADLYVSKSIIFPKTRLDALIGLFFFVFIWVFETAGFTSNISKSAWEVIQLVSIFFLFYYVIFHKALKFLSYPFITNIGGMCYSIYMLHSPIIYVFGKYIVMVTFSKYSVLNFSIYLILLLAVILFISAIFFQLIERPCMERDGYKKLFKRPKKIKENSF
ncbi:acyltransferase family protein [Patiriisocius sp. Uisw_017]|jgi:peptidoglycan/LPS O-acetylase OafA/YrhL|uniref:acyltransferase family protein n=1 Tax=Patiriisocius sp. Uisw_017 TaxID=3230968 RepID=UPI0039EB3C38